MDESMKGPIVLVGNNDLRLCEATMIEAVSFWLRNKVLNPHEEAPRVIGVSEDTSCNTFVVTLTDKQP